MSETQAYVLPARFRIDEYEIDDVLGMGGFGITYLATDQNLDGRVAIKEYFPQGVAARTDGLRVAAASTMKQEVFDWGLDRFLQEARIIHRLRHPSIVRVHRYVERHGTAYIVMEYVEGESLASILESRGRLPPDEWRPWLDRLLDGLAHVHEHEHLHRDIKPANIVIRKADDEPVLIDFGAARLASSQRTHMQVLTPGYAPYEQHTSEGKQGHSTDIYALAAVSCRVLTGELPPDARDRMLHDRYEPLAERVDSARPGWLAAIDHGLALRSEDRPQTVAAWRMALSEPLDAAKIEEFLEAASQNDARARAQLRTEAHAGNPEAQFALGQVYEHTDDYPAAVAWYHRAASQGQVEAQFTLGETLRKGVPPNEELAEVWLRRAAVQGHVQAQFTLGVIFADGYGHGLPVDYAEAVTWLRKAAENGYFEARLKLGQMYSHGEGVPCDLVIAYMWFAAAESMATPLPVGVDGPYERALAAKLEIEPDMTSSEIEEATRLARAYTSVIPQE